MTGDPAEEAEQRRQMRAMESRARHLPADAPPPDNDPVHALRIRKDGTPPGTRTYAIARWSLAARLISDAADDGLGREITDLGTLPSWVLQPEPGELVQVGIRGPDGWLYVVEELRALADAIADLDTRSN